MAGVSGNIGGDRGDRAISGPVTGPVTGPITGPITGSIDRAIDESIRQSDAHAGLHAPVFALMHIGAHEPAWTPDLRPGSQTGQQPGQQADCTPQAAVDAATWVGRRIALALRAGDVAMPCGPHDVLCLMTRLRDAAEAHAVARLLMRSMALLPSVRPSIGIALYPRDGQTATDLVAVAAAALARARRLNTGIASVADVVNGLDGSQAARADHPDRAEPPDRADHAGRIVSLASYLRASGPTHGRA